MNEMLINTLDGNAIKFVGRLISQAQGDVEHADGMNRSFDLRLYATADGGFAAVTEYITECESEPAGCIVELVDLAKDVENFYFVFEPEELLPKLHRMATREESDAWKQLSNRLKSIYEKLTSEILDDLDAFVVSQPSSERVAAASIVKSSGVWNKLLGKG